MTRRRPCPVAPGPLEGYAARFDDLFGSLAQRRGFREYLAGLLAPRDRNKTLTALAGAGPVTGARHPAVQRLRFFLSESRRDPDQVTPLPPGIPQADAKVNKLPLVTSGGNHPALSRSDERHG